MRILTDHKSWRGVFLSRTASVWLCVYGAILAAWFALAMMAADMPGFGMMRFTAPLIWEALCLSAANAEPMALFGMWAVMSVAMMLPTFVPALSTFQDLGATGASDARSVASLVLGYLVVWLVFSGLAGLAQAGLAGLSLVGPDGASTSLGLTALLLAGAGGYQFSTLKEACLSRCRAPLTFFMERWEAGAGPAFRMGGQLGLHCLGCCWALMLLGFVGGTMNLIWMGLATVFMVMEKLPQLGVYLTRPAGFILLGSAGLVALRAVGLI